MKTCPNCGEPVFEFNKVCMHCGHSLVEDESSEAPKKTETEIEPLFEVKTQRKKSETKDTSTGKEDLRCPNCGAQIFATNLECGSCGASLNGNGAKIVEQYTYVPIDYSELHKILPPDDKVIYSTLCNANEGNVYQTRWNTHVLFTNRNVAFYTPKMIGKKTKPIYIPLDKLDKILHNQGFQMAGYGNFRLKRDKNLETKEAFKARRKMFRQIINRWIYKSVRDRLEFLEKHQDDDEIYNKKKVKKLKSKLNELQVGML